MNADRIDDTRNAGRGFPRRCRLTRTDDFSSVFGFRRALKSAHFLLHYRPRAETPESGASAGGARLGVVVPKRLVKAAVRRNLIKRLCREQFRLLQPDLPGFDLVMRLASKPGVIDRGQLAAEMRKLMQKLGTGGAMK